MSDLVVNPEDRFSHNEARIDVTASASKGEVHNIRFPLEWLFCCLICCFTFTVNSRGHFRTVSNPTTLFLGKPPRHSLPVISIHSFATNKQQLLNQQMKMNSHKRICQTLGSGTLYHLHLKWHCYQPSYSTQFIGM